MKKAILLTFATIAMFSCGRFSNDKIKYPVTEKIEVTDDYFGTKVTDPYRWLEDDRSEQTAEWVRKENEVTFTYLENIPLRNEIRSRLGKMWNYERFSAPFTEGSYIYFYKNDGLQNQSVLYRQKEGSEPEVFLDPNTFSKDGTVSLSEMDFSTDGNLIAYSISEGGSDWRKVVVMDVNSKKVLEDTLENIKFSGLSWKGSEGFFYSSYEKPEGSQLSAMTDHHKLYFHRLGSKQSDDQVVFGADIKRRYVGGYVTEDDRYLIVGASISTSGNELYIKDLTKPSSGFLTISDDIEHEHEVVDNDGPKLFIMTNANAPNRKIVSVDASAPGQENWKDFIPETQNVLTASSGSGFIFTNYITDAISKVFQYDLQGKMVREIPLPGVGSAGGFSGKKSDKDIYFTFTNYITPPSIYKMAPVAGNIDVYKKPDVDFNPEDFESKQVFYNSKDGTRIPMIITYKKGTELNGKNPTILYGYGGFNISLTPSFSTPMAFWIKSGGIYAVPNIRGGGEYGEKWHLAGTRMNKQNVFDDFIAAAEYLIAEKYTSSDYLAIMGGSNGGLLVGAVMTQRPDLMKVALPAVGVMDMLRYHKFTAGAGWAYDYGTSEDNKEMFEYIYGYSPVHNIRKGVNYPATLVTTADHDDRVVPAHSFKFAAQLQDKQAGSNPVLIRIETRAGHGAGTPVSKAIELYADLFGFTLHNMGIKKLLE